MSNLQDIIKLANLDPNSKYFILDSEGEVSLVILPVSEYQKMLGSKLVKAAADIEKINQEIIQAQLREVSTTPNFPQTKHSPVDMREEVIDPNFDFDSPISIDSL